VKATVDKDTCVGCALCSDICPEMFVMEDDGKAVAKVDQVPPGAEDSGRDGASQCPVEAIAIQEG
jgi:ferredoxin